MAPATFDSAVLCVLYEDRGGPHVLLTRRAPTLRHHAHEVSFPGGRRDITDPDLWHTAVREAEEEVGLDPTSVIQLGGLDRFSTIGSRTLIHPFVAVSETVPEVTIASPQEVEAIIRVPLAELLSDEVWREEIWGIRDSGRGRSPSSRSKATPSGVQPVRCSGSCSRS